MGHYDEGAGLLIIRKPIGCNCLAGDGGLSCQSVETLSKGLAPVKVIPLQPGSQSVVGAVGPGGAAVLRLVNGNVELVNFIPGGLAPTSIECNVFTGGSVAFCLHLLTLTGL
jgi:hypothetical protein